ncbi:glucose dehydrogenase short protein [Mycena galericulata]|nr:glucose dehydrogenase short protein [Mycena galericulata]
MLLTWSLLTVASWLLNPCLGKIYEDVSDLPGLEYDFVIVGGGASGNVVANRLTENPNFSVLVLEAGVSLVFDLYPLSFSRVSLPDESGSNEGVLDSIVPGLFGALFSGPNIYEWNYTTTPQIGLNNRSLAYPRAHILGGCTAHNAMIYTRGSAEDFDRYAAVTGDPGWSWDNLLPYFFKNEKWTEPADHHDTRGQFNASVHSFDGINSVSLNGYAWPIFDQHVLETTKEFSDEFPFNLDFNSGRMLGVGWLQSTIGGGERSTSATSYLAPKFAQRKNLNVLLNAQVSQLVNSSQTDGDLTFGGVEFLQGGSLFTAKATKEIILSAGSVGTPNILMHSGIGDRDALTALNIPSLLHLPSVGQNATDQPMLNVSWFVNSTQTMGTISHNATLYNEAFVEWNRSHTGPFVEIPLTHIAWLRLNPDSPIFENVTDPSAGPNTPHIEMYMGPGWPSDLPFPGNFMNLGVAVLNPTSRGSITLQSNNPFDPPLIDVGMLQTDFDIFTARESIKSAYRFVQAPVWQDYVIAPTMDLSNLSTDALDEFIRNNASPSSHLVSTSAMTARNASYGVVNPDLLVKGIRGLSIIDASILPFIPSAHTQAASYVVGERGADLVKQRWK